MNIGFDLDNTLIDQPYSLEMVDAVEAMIEIDNGRPSMYSSKFIYNKNRIFREEFVDKAIASVSETIDKAFIITGAWDKHFAQTAFIDDFSDIIAKKIGCARVGFFANKYKWINSEQIALHKADCIMNLHIGCYWDDDVKVLPMLRSIFDANGYDCHLINSHTYATV